MMKKAQHDYIELSFLYVFAVFTVVLLSLVATPTKIIHLGIITPKEKKSEVPSLYNQKPFEGIHVRAKAYIVYDLVGKQIISAKNENEVLPLASITKVMTAVSALSHASSTKVIIIKPESIDGGYDLGLKKDQTWKLLELLKYTLVFSSNDGANAIADGLGGRENFISQMNTDATLLGLPTLHFTSPSGIDVGKKLGGQGSALEVAKLLSIARKRFPEILDATTKTRATVSASNGKISGIPNTNQDIMNLVGAEASKTGFTDNAGGNLAVVVDIALGHPVVIVVLGSTYEERFSDVETLYHSLQESLETKI